ncbi:MAG: inositol monophosphatase family protein [Candidatus Hodgkinia cicadicola]
MEHFGRPFRKMSKALSPKPLERSPRRLLKLVNVLLDVGREATRNVCWGAVDSFQYGRSAETIIMDGLKAMTPATSFWGKCLGYFRTEVKPSAGTWIVDLLFRLDDAIRGWPIWGSVMCLVQEDCVTLSAIDLPSIDERLLASNGRTYLKRYGGHCERLPLLQPSNVKARDCVVAASASMKKSTTEVCALALLRLEINRMVQDFGLNAISLLVQGKIDAVIECGLPTQTIASITPILQGVGCVVTDWEGRNTCCSNRIIAARSRSLSNELVSIVGHHSR